MAENLAINGSNFQFIDRIYEIETIAQSLTQLLNKKEIVQKPLIELNGIGGIGKTTILCELTRECQRRQLSFALVDFSLERDKAAQIHKSFISRIIKQIDIKNNSLEKLNSVLAFEHSNQLDIERCFLEYLQEIIYTQNTPIALFLDSLDEAEEKILHWLSSLITETIDKGKILFVLASKHALNLAIDERTQKKYYTYRLQQFDIDFTEEQIKQFKKDSSSKEIKELSRKIYNLTKGHPLGNNIIGQIINAKNISNKEFYKNETLFLRKILDEVIEKWVFRGLSEAEKLKFKSILQPLSIARWFNLISLQMLIEAFTKTEYKLNSSLSYSKYIRKLQAETYFVRYYPPKSGYEVDPTIATAFSLSLQIEDENRYKEIHTKLALMYRSWLDESHGLDKIKYIKELIYHELELGILEKNIIYGIKKYIAEFKNIENRHLCLQFIEEIEKDEDIPKLMGEELGDLIKDLEKS